jgi:hypothetical protein
VKQSNNILVSADGGHTWNPGTRGISGTMAEGSRIQKHAGRLYLASGTTLYHTDEADLQWSKIDLLELADASGGVSGTLVAKEGVYVQKGSEDVVLFPWSDFPTSARDAPSSTPENAKAPSVTVTSGWPAKRLQIPMKPMNNGWGAPGKSQE